MTPEEKKKKILEMQAPSTRRALENPSWRDDFIPGEWKAVPDAKTLDEAVNARSLSFQEVQVYSQMRYNRGAVLAQMRKEPETSSVTPEKKSNAVMAFMFIKTKFKDLMRFAGLATEKEIVMYDWNHPNEK